MTMSDLGFARGRRHTPAAGAEDVSTPESREVARLQALLKDPAKAGFRAELEQELAAARG
jgi:hypothetical protein